MKTSSKEQNEAIQARKLQILLQAMQEIEEAPQNNR